MSLLASESQKDMSSSSSKQRGPTATNNADIATINGPTFLLGNRQGATNNMCFAIIGTSWDELERAIDDVGKFHRLRRHLLARLVYTAASCTAMASIAILAPGWPGSVMRWDGRVPSMVLVVGEFLIAYGDITGIRNFARMQTLMDSPSNICNLSQSSRFTRFCLQQICTYLSSLLTSLAL
ncbi:hypothetical protein BD769DRAFT_1776981 [Suillus cothurnatus]|nr:hypothetical protein BD769DRAFT_1776981 [Suillus cothurnatus]